MKNVAGPPVEGEDFWGRETELQMLVDLLQEGRSVLLVAQRRIGKTSLMRETARRLQDQCLCLMVNVENCASTAEAITEISAETRQYAPAWEKAKQVFGNILKQGTQQIDSLQMGEIKATFRAGLAGVSWQDKGERLFEGLAKLDRPVVILMDEVPILIGRMLRGPDNQIMPEGRQEADLFLSWLRSISLKYQPCICFVVTGSIGLGPILKQASLSAMVNHLSPFDLKPWDRDVAYGFLERSHLFTSSRMLQVRSTYF